MGKWRQNIFGFFLVVAAMLAGCTNGGSDGEMWDDTLGDITWNESTGVWEASVVVAPGTNVGISLDTFGEDVDPKLIQKVRDFISQYREIDAKLREAAAEALLESRNEFWSEDEGDIDSDDSSLECR